MQNDQAINQSTASLEQRNKLIAQDNKSDIHVPENVQPQTFDFNAFNKYVQQLEAYAKAKDEEAQQLTEQLNALKRHRPIGEQTVPTESFISTNPIVSLAALEHDPWNSNARTFQERALSGEDADIALAVKAYLQYDVISLPDDIIAIWDRSTLLWKEKKSKFLKQWIKTDFCDSYKRLVLTLERKLRENGFKDDKEYKQMETSINMVKRVVKRLKNRASLLAIKNEALDDLCNDEFRERFDKTVNCISVKGGILVNLRTGEARYRVRQDYWTSECDVIYDPNAKSEKFDKFLSDITLGREELAEYLSFALGMGLCGEILYQLLFIFYGVGANGKGLLMSIMKKIMGKMQVAANKEIFVETRAAAEGAASPYLAQLEGKRIIQCNEPPSNGVLNESLIKQLTGEDWVNARKLNQDAMEFKPIGKTYIICNDPLKVSNDPAMWRRPRMVPFDCKFVDKTEGLASDQRTADSSFGKSITEDPVAMSAAFNWLLKGCRLAYERFDAGLGPLECKWVTDATMAYRQEQDIYATFTSECLECDSSMRPSDGMKQAQVLDLFRKWITHRGDTLPPGLNATNFGRAMKVPKHPTGNKEYLVRAKWAPGCNDANKKEITTQMPGSNHIPPAFNGSF